MRCAVRLAKPGKHHYCRTATCTPGLSARRTESGDRSALISARRRASCGRRRRLPPPSPRAPPRPLRCGSSSATRFCWATFSAAPSRPKPESERAPQGWRGFDRGLCCVCWCSQAACVKEVHQMNGQFPFVSRNTTQVPGTQHTQTQDTSAPCRVTGLVSPLEPRPPSAAAHTPRSALCNWR